MKTIQRQLFLIGGGLCVAFALVGIAIPVLPTTPFLLLAVFFFARSSRRAHDWLLHNRWFGGYIRRYHEGHGIALRDKIITIALLWLTILLSAFLLVESWPVRGVMLAIAAGVTTHLLRTKTYRPPRPERDAAKDSQPFPEAD
jgi:uncharacterized membrane protein YbaN (DUF454 family)